jgi:hypothetical protein
MGVKKNNEDNYIKHVSNMLTDTEAAWIAEWVKACGADKHQYVRAALLEFTGRLQLEQNRRIKRAIWQDAPFAIMRRMKAALTVLSLRAKDVVPKRKGA